MIYVLKDVEFIRLIQNQLHHHHGDASYITFTPSLPSALSLIPGSGRITLNIREIEERRRIRLEDMGEGQSAEVWTEQELW